MLSSSWLQLALGLVGLGLVPTGHAAKQAALRIPAGPSYRGKGENCPARCSTAGPDYGNWSLYHSLDQTALCENTLFSVFNIYDNVDDSASNHRIYSCSSYGTEWSILPSQNPQVAVVNNTNITYELGWWTDGFFHPAVIQGLAREMGKYFTNGHATANNSAILFAQSGGGAAGVYIGKALQNEGIAQFALGYVRDNILSLNVHSGNVAFQQCGQGHNADYTFGFIAASNGSFSQVQDAIQTWNKGECVSSFYATQNVSGPSFFTSNPALGATNGTNATISTNSTQPSLSRFRARHSTQRLSARADCSTAVVVSGDSCASLATKCGITGTQLSQYNPASNFCSTLQPGQHVCCSSGTLPDFAPKPNPDGSCATYTVASGDTCSQIAATNSLTLDNLNEYNANTWGWEGCSNLFVGTIICLSTGSPPMPAPDANALCGPTVPGTQMPTNGTALSDLNPCPLNACCDIWGQCGITAEFCTNTSTGAPGTAKPGTNGCISNCGTSIVKSGAPATYRNIAYYEGYNFDRACLYQDISQIGAAGLTHLHFSFGTLDPNTYAVGVGDAMSQYEFSQLLRIQGPLRILTIGGWAFSTDPSTYTIFRNGVTAANRLAMATSIANFIKENNLDGVDIDWEYPGAPDIPGIPPASTDDGANYLAFLVILKNLLGGKSLSIAAPASYWYLKGFPIKQISQVVDYIVFMTYDLHGQWDYANAYSQDGCPTGNCLRSHVNLTETLTALAMVTKAGVPSNKVVVGVTSYGRSFAMAQAGCNTPDCFFTGSAQVSNAEKGPCTGTAGYISNAEINDIAANASRVTMSYVDEGSNSNILVYDNTQWVAYMDDAIKAERTTYYQAFEMGGSTLWASDLAKYNDAPYPSKDWTNFVMKASIGGDPNEEGNRTGNWTTLTCTDPAIADLFLTPEERWGEADGANAWIDLLNVWTQVDYPADHSAIFSQSISSQIHGPEYSNCGQYGSESYCDKIIECNQVQGAGSGPIAYEIWNSLVIVHGWYENYIDNLNRAFSGVVSPSLAAMENDFAPVSPPPSDEWLGILLAVIGLVGTVATSALFNSFLSALPYFKANKALYDNLKDTGKALVSFTTSLTSALEGGSVSGGTWTAQDNNVFSQYMGQAALGWANVTELAMEAIFSGVGDGLTTLENLVAGGKLISGSVGGGATRSSPVASANTTTQADMEALVAKSFYAFAIPALWNFSSTYTFVVDSGAACSTTDPLSEYMSSDDMTVSGHCYQNDLYYLVYPHESTNTDTCTDNPDTGSSCSDYIFAAAPGITSLDGRFGGVTLAELITGAVNTYKANGNANGAPIADPSNPATLDALYGGDVTTPGFINIPVCAPDRAQAAINAKQTSVLNYPCNPLQMPSDCGDSTFVDQTTDASPTVDDCMQIVKNIQNALTTAEWEVENAVEEQHQIAQYGTCKFGVQGTAINGNVDFHVGGQDVIDIITDAVKQFAWNGLVGAKGEMNCNGDVKQQSVEWGLY